jgi:hypothetical protein
VSIAAARSANPSARASGVCCAFAARIADADGSDSSKGELLVGRSLIPPPPHRGVPGVSKTALWGSWKEVRKKLRDSSLRDVVDWVEYDVDPEKWILRLRDQVLNGRYEPHRPIRFPLGKSKGLSRWMTLPAVPDLVLFHAIATRIVARAQRRRRRHRHVYFMRDRISKVQKEALDDATKKIRQDPQYRTGFYVWLRFHQYRRWLIFKRLYPFIVVTDITNFFDSILYTQLEATLFELGIQRNVVGLLFLILERLSIRDAYSALPRIGLPVDEFDCSRCLAHAVLFPHDDRMVGLAGEAAYVRWMDDQTFGVKSEADAYAALAQVNASLRRMHLVANAGKTQILSLAQARRYFHFDINDVLDRVEKLCNRGNIRRARADLRALWQRALAHERHGEWNKILKRFYLYAGRIGLRFLVRRAHEDVLHDPALAERIARYLRVVCLPAEFLQRIAKILADRRIVYDDVRRTFGEELLRLETTAPTDVRELRGLATNALRGGDRTDAIPPEVAALLLLRVGDGRSWRTFRRILVRNCHAPSARAVGFAIASCGSSGAAAVRTLAERDLEGPLRLVARFSEAVELLPALPERIRARLQLRFDAIEHRKYLDMRTLLIARLFARSPGCRAAVLDIVKRWQPDLSPFERRLVAARVQ